MLSLNPTQAAHDSTDITLVVYSIKTEERLAILSYMYVYVFELDS